MTNKIYQIIVGFGLLSLSPLWALTEDDSLSPRTITPRENCELLRQESKNKELKKSPTIRIQTPVHDPKTDEWRIEDQEVARYENPNLRESWEKLYDEPESNLKENPEFNSKENSESIIPYFLHLL